MAAHIQVKKPGDLRFFQHKPGGVALVGRRVLVGRAAGVEQQLQRQRQTGLLGQNGAHHGQRAARAVTAHGQAAGVDAQRLALRGQPLQGVPRVVGRGRELMLRGQPVVQRQHRAARQQAQLAAQNVMRGDAAHHKTTTMKVQQCGQRPLSRLAGRIQPRGQGVAVARGQREVFNTGQHGFGDFQHIGPGGIGSFGLQRAQVVQARMFAAVQPGHARQHALHRGRQHGRAGRAGDRCGWGVRVCGQVIQEAGY